MTRPRAFRVAVFLALALATTRGALAQSAQPAASSPDALSPAQLPYACAPPPLTGIAAATGVRIVGGQDTRPRLLFGRGDVVLISGGTDAGVQLGSRYFTKHDVPYGNGTRAVIHTPHTTGWVRVVAVNVTTAVATVEFACDGLLAGDYLAPFSAPEIPSDAEPRGGAVSPDFQAALGRVLFGVDAHDIGATGEFMLFDRGATQGMTPGLHLAIYRDTRVAGAPLTPVGDAIVVSTAETTSVMRIQAARDAVQNGDYVVPKH